MPIEFAMQGVIFDLDDTLLEGHYDWPEIRERVGVTDERVTILEYLNSLSHDERQPRQRLLEQYEYEATRRGHLKPGAHALLHDLRQRNLKLGLVTNNSRRNVDWVLERFDLRFDSVQTRDSGYYKPSPKPLLLAARELGLPTAALGWVGDHELDLRAGRDAEMGLVIIVNVDRPRFEGRCDHALPDLDAVRGVLLSSNARDSAPRRRPTGH